MSYLVSSIHFGFFCQTFSVNFLHLVFINFLHFTSRVISRANSYQLNDMEGLEKKNLQKTRKQKFEINLFVSKRKSFIKLFKISLMITSSTANVEKGFLVLILPLTKLQNDMAQNSSN